MASRGIILYSYPNQSLKELNLEVPNITKKDVKDFYFPEIERLIGGKAGGNVMFKAVTSEALEHLKLASAEKGDDTKPPQKDDPFVWPDPPIIVAGLREFVKDVLDQELQRADKIILPVATRELSQLQEVMPKINDFATQEKIVEIVVYES